MEGARIAWLHSPAPKVAGYLYDGTVLYTEPPQPAVYVYGTIEMELEDNVIVKADSGERLILRKGAFVWLS